MRAGPRGKGGTQAVPTLPRTLMKKRRRARGKLQRYLPWGRWGYSLVRDHAKYGGREDIDPIPKEKVNKRRLGGQGVVDNNEIAKAVPFLLKRENNVSQGYTAIGSERQNVGAALATIRKELLEDN